MHKLNLKVEPVLSNKTNPLAAILSVSSTVLSDEEKLFLKKANPLGIILFKRNIQDKKQLKTLIDSIKNAIDRDDVLIALDEEGGRVDRLAVGGFRPFASQKTLSVIGKTDVIEMHAKLIASDMHSIGANVNFSPVIDLMHEKTSSVLEGRTFGSDPFKTAEYGRVMWQTYAQNGICPCIKHIPGHGRAKSDTHLGMAVIDCDMDELSPDFFPFIINKDCPAAMVAHVILSEIDDKPVSVSSKAIREVVRGLLDYQGFLFSDALEMKALDGSVYERARASFEAGVDAVCYCGGDMKGLNDVYQTHQELTAQALDKFQKIKEIFISYKPQTNLDLSREKYYACVSPFENVSVGNDATEALFNIT